MESRILTLDIDSWQPPTTNERWIEAVESGQVLYFPRLPFVLARDEQKLLRPELLQKGVRNISLDTERRLKGVVGDPAAQAAVTDLVGRFAAQAITLVHSLFPRYEGRLRVAPTSLRPVEVSTRAQSWRADDRRLHVDAFPSRPNRGERILRVFSNINPMGEPRVWRVGEPFEAAARHFLPCFRRFSPLQAGLLHRLRVTKSLRSEYDHLMLQLHDAMKFDLRYQREAPQQTFGFPPGSSWICFSDQTVHAAMSGQHLIEQTLHLPVESQYNRDASPLAILTRLAGHPLI
ncbi:MAG: putative Kdo-hydroxylase [Ramlibacter sp.]|nr:putative Kdo-hydroxylase [Ramlibacter sp.]